MSEEQANSILMKFNKDKRKSLHLGRKSSLQQYRLRTDEWGAALSKRAWSSGRQQHELAAPCQQRGPAASRAVVTRAAHQGKGLSPSTHHLLDHIWNTV